MKSPAGSAGLSDGIGGLSGWRRAVVGRYPRRTLVRLGAIVVGSAVIFGLWLQPVRTQGVSMLPGYQPGRFELVNVLAYRWSAPRRGDVVAIRLAGRRVLYLKRVVGLPTERVEFDGGVIVVDGDPLDEPYVEHDRGWTVPPVTVGADEYYVVGDNRGMPADQHVFGLVVRARIIGKVIS